MYIIILLFAPTTYSQHTPTVDIAGTAFVVFKAGDHPGVIVDFGHSKHFNPYGLPLPAGTPNTLAVAAPLTWGKYWDSLAPGDTVTFTVAGYSFADTTNAPLGCIQFDIVKPIPYPWQKLASAIDSEWKDGRVAQLWEGFR